MQTINIRLQAGVQRSNPRTFQDFKDVQRLVAAIEHTNGFSMLLDKQRINRQSICR